MRRIATLLAGTTFIATASPAIAQDAAPAAQPADEAGATAAPDEDSGEVVVTARRREETLQDVPVAITAVSGDTLERRGINSVREVAALSPGLNISSDGAGRAFVSIRGVGVTLVQSVQPGVGLFVDGVYRPSTAYLNNPLLDVERIEVLRGPQGTLYGKNTLGGAINVITRTPGNELAVRGIASYAGPDDSWLVAGSISLPVITDQLAIRIAGSHREQDGFLTNSVIGGDANPLNTDSINGTIRFAPGGGNVVLTINGYYDWVNGTNTPYSRVTGPTDYRRDVPTNALGRVEYRYRGINARLVAPLESINSTLTLTAAYDARNGESPDSDVDFGPANIARSFGEDRLRTRTLEARFESELSDQISTLFGLFYSNETTHADSTTVIVPLARIGRSLNDTDADTYAAFGTIFWRPNDQWEVAAGLRYDHENRQAIGSVSVNGVGAALPDAQIKSDEWEPRVTVTRHWNNRFMSYASVARGYRGGGFNAPTAPVRAYQGDSAWTYEFGSRYVSADRRFNISGAVFYNDYSNYIGLNSIAPSSAGGFVTVDLNTGDVESYGAELEASFRITPQWTVSGGLTYMHARITDSTAYTAVTGRLLSSDRLTFQPDWTYSLNSDYAIPLGAEDTLTLSAGLTGKGSRLAATLNQTTPTFLDGYTLVNASIAYRHGPVELSVFANNILQEDYFESYIEQTTLALAGIPPSDVGIIGDRRRIGARVRFEF
ncbi:MAG TPA: TonB-dependent receptor [Allosphingosinicella sp.]|nr:TonB-dependent receptor [Allosphingosinicella sp.]